VYTVLSETEVRLDGIADATAEASGGFLTIDPNSYPALAIFRAGSRNIVHGRGFPSRLQRAFSLGSSDSALVDSVVSNVHSWRPVTMPGGSADYGVHGALASAAIAVALGDVSRVAIRNNLFENCLGLTIYAEQFRASSELTPSDIVIQGNTFRNQDAYRAGSDSSNGRYYGIRHAIEFKRAQRIRIEDNVFDGNWADWTPLGPAIGLLTRADGEAVNNRVQDVSIRNNVFRRVATGIQILSTDDRVEQPSLPIARIAIENNLFKNIDFYQMRSAPSSVGLLYPSSNFGGQVLYAGGVLEDLTFRYNTVLDNRGRGPAIFWFVGGRGSGVQLTDNVLTHNDDFGYGGLPRAHHASLFETTPKGGPSDAFRHTFTQTPDPDPRSAFARNLIVPGVRSSSDPAAYDDPQARSNFTKSDCASFYAGFEEIECAGSGQAGETASQRIAAVFPDREDLRQSNGRGADLSGLSALSKSILSPLATILSGAATIAFETGSAETCLVDVSQDEQFASFRRFPDPGGQLHSVPLDGLEPGHYRYRITCASDTLFGEISVP
jgi:hypothetical protein